MSILTTSWNLPTAPARSIMSSRKAAANRGYVLDGWPKTGGAAKWAFTRIVPLTEAEVAEKAKVREVLHVHLVPCSLRCVSPSMRASFP